MVVCVFSMVARLSTRILCAALIGLTFNSSYAMKPDVIGYYGNHKEIDYRLLDSAVRSCVSGVLYGERVFPSEENKECMDFILDCHSDNFSQYLNKSGFKSFCDEQRQKWKDDEIVIRSIAKCEEIFESGDDSRKASVYILLKEALLQIESKKRP